MRGTGDPFHKIMKTMCQRCCGFFWSEAGFGICNSCRDRRAGIFQPEPEAAPVTARDLESAAAEARADDIAWEIRNGY